MSKYYLRYLETDITNICNLNCIGCEHFSCLTNKDNMYIYDISTFKKHIKRLSDIFIIDTFRILGGEPFILKNLDEYVKIVRELFPFTKISIYTNGTLTEEIDRIRNLFADDTRFSITLSAYPIDMVSNNSIYAQVKDKTFFRNMNLNLRGDSYPEIAKSFCNCKNCPSLGCDGKIYICPVMRNIFIFEQEFNIELDIKENENGVSIYSTPQEIIDHMNSFDKGLKLCRFCNAVHPKVEWAKTNKKIDEFIIKE